jgi:CheY-like chemotaxis protein
MQPRVITLNGVVADIAKLLKRLIGADIELHTCLSPDPGSVKADPSQIEQVIMNLVVNSRDAMPDGGRITIETGNVVLDEAYGRTHVGVAAGPYVMLAISDTGHGISEEVKAHLFEPFFTTKDRGKGTGLGLSTVYGIVRQSGGVIWVYSEVGQGTTFKIFFPRTDEPWQRTERGRPSVEEGIATGEETILLAEDEAVVRQWVAEALTKQGYDVIAASSPAEAIELAQRYDKPIHLLLTDVVMPGMSGRELASRIRAVRSDIRVLYMSGYTENAVVHHGILDPNVVLLQKPFGEEMLSRKIRDVLEHS